MKESKYKLKKERKKETKWLFKSWSRKSGIVTEKRCLMRGLQVLNDALHSGFFVAVLYLSSNGSFLEYRCHFHQHLRAHFLYKFWCQSQNVTRKAAKKDIRMKKAREKTLMKLMAVRFHFKLFARIKLTYLCK
jgi:hypothetical protein